MIVKTLAKLKRTFVPLPNVKKIQTLNKFGGTYIMFKGCHNIEPEPSEAAQPYGDILHGGMIILNYI